MLNLGRRVKTLQAGLSTTVPEWLRATLHLEDMTCVLQTGPVVVLAVLHPVPGPTGLPGAQGPWGCRRAWAVGSAGPVLGLCGLVLDAVRLTGSAALLPVLHQDQTHE